MHNDTCDSTEASTSGRFPMIVQNGMSVNFPVVGQISAAPPSENRGFVSTLYPSPRKLQVALNPRFVSKFSPSLRMRPYYIPERSRTKSENNAEPMNSHHVAGHQFPELLIPSPSLLVDDDDDDDVDLLPSTSQHPFARLTHRNSMMTIDDDTSGELPQSQDAFNLPATAYDTAPPATRITAAAAVQLPTMRKSRSMEDICRGVRSTDAGSQASHEMEFMSSRIQKMKVQD